MIKLTTPFTLRAIVMLTLMLYAARREGIAPFPYIRLLDRLGPQGGLDHMKVYTCGKKFLLTTSNRSRPVKSISKANFSLKTRRITVASRPEESATSIQRGGEEFLPIYVLCHVSRSTQGTAARLHSVSPKLSQQFLHQDFHTANFDNRFLLSCWGTMSARLRPLLTETVIRSLSGADFTAGELMTGARPITVYLRVLERELQALAPLVRLLFASFIDELITTYDEAGGKGCRPVLILADEAGRTAIPMLADHAATVVGRRISLWVAVQSLSQLKVVYGAYRADTLMNNCDSQIFYR